MVLFAIAVGLLGSPAWDDTALAQGSGGRTGHAGLTEAWSLADASRAAPGTKPEVALPGTVQPAQTNDTAVVDVSVMPRSTMVGTTINITARVENLGPEAATFDVNATAPSFQIGTKTVSIPSGGFENVTFLWDTSAVPPASYSIRVQAEALPGETNESNNEFQAGIVDLLPRPIRVTVTANPTATTASVPVEFTCEAKDGVSPYRYRWNFTERPPSSLPTDRRAWPSPGTKVATCTVTDARNANATARLEVVVAPQPVVLANADRLAARPDRPLTFYSITTGGTPPLIHTWSFHDGESATGASVVHAYKREGQYLVTVSVRDAVGVGASASLTVTISELTVAHTQTAVRLELVSREGGEPRTEVVTFTALAGGGAGGPYTYSWEFGDGSTWTGPIATHFYVQDGKFRPSVTVSDGSGLTSKVFLTEIEVVLPVQAFTLPPEVVFTVASAIAMGLGVGLVLSVRRRRRRRRWGPRPH